MAVTNPTAAAGWYPDPIGHGEFRWWTGTQWTYRIASGGQIYAEPAGDLSRLALPESSPIAGDGQIAPRGMRSASAAPAGASQMAAPRSEVLDVQLSAGAAFKAGFFAFWGWLTASLILFLILLALLIPLSICAAGSVRSSIP